MPSFEEAPRAVRLGRWLFRHRSLKFILLLPVLLFYAEVENPLVTWPVGLALVLLGGALRLWSISFIGRSARTRKDKAKHVITSGPFALCRNPIYVGNVIAVCGFIVLCEVVWFAPVYLALSYAFYSFVVRYEEYLLTAIHPVEYQEYMQSVPRWLPRLNVAALARPAHGLAEVLRRERSFFYVSLSGIAFAIAKEIVSGQIG